MRRNIWLTRINPGLVIRNILNVKSRFVNTILTITLNKINVKSKISVVFKESLLNQSSYIGESFK